MQPICHCFRSEWTTNCHNQTIFWPTIDGKPTSTAILLLPTNRIYGVSFSIIVWLKAGLIHPMLLWWETTMGQLIWFCLTSSPFLEKSSKLENISSLPIFLNNSRHVIFRQNKLFPGHWQCMAKWRNCWERICFGEKYQTVQFWWLFSKVDLRRQAESDEFSPIISSRKGTTTIASLLIIYFWKLIMEIRKVSHKLN